MSVRASVSVGRFQGNKSGPRNGVGAPPEGLTKRRRILLVAISHPMYLCPPTGGNLPDGKGRTDG
jgi:hypothetical protein